MYITYLLLAATILISVKAFSDSEFRTKWLFNPYMAVHHKQWYRALSHAFIHAHWPHLLFNMFVLYSFAIQITPNVPAARYNHLSLEPYLIETYGNKGYLIFLSLYVGGMLFSNTISLVKHKDNPGYNALGASGAVMAVLFAYIFIFPTSSLGFIFLPGISIPAYILGPLILVAEYYMGKRGGTGIAHDAHFAGAIFGIVFICIVDYHYLLNFFTEIASSF